MGNDNSVPSKTASGDGGSTTINSSSGGSTSPPPMESARSRAKEFGSSVSSAIKGASSKSRRQLEEEDANNPAQFIIDNVCSPMGLFGSVEESSSKERRRRSRYGRDSYDSNEDMSVDDQTISDEEGTLDSYDDRRGGRSNRGRSGRRRGRRNEAPVAAASESSSFVSQSMTDDYTDSVASTVDRGDKKGREERERGDRGGRGSNRHDDEYSHATFDSELQDGAASSALITDRYGGGKKERPHDTASIASSGVAGSDVPSLLSKPLASSFAKRCYFTKAGIGKTTQHYEGLTLTGNVVLMLASAMKLKGCPTICDEDLRRVEQTYPNQFSRLPDELLLSSGWRRISKYCHFSNKPVPDGIPFFHSKERLHPQGGYYFLLAAAVGMVRPIDVEPLTRDTLIVLETDYAAQCDAAPEVLIQDPNKWTLVDKFCFFSGGPINTEEDVYYRADFDGNAIYMLAFLSPSLTPEELYRLGPDGDVEEEHGLKSVAAVEEVESVYDLTERDFDDLKLYHLGPCRALPQYILQPQAWTKVLPPHFKAARQKALDRAREYEAAHPPPQAPNAMMMGAGVVMMDGSVAGSVPNGVMPPQQQLQHHIGSGMETPQAHGGSSGGYVELAPGRTGHTFQGGEPPAPASSGGGPFYNPESGGMEWANQQPHPSPYPQSQLPPSGGFRSPSPNTMGGGFSSPSPHAMMDQNFQQQHSMHGEGIPIGMSQDEQMHTYYQQTPSAASVPSASSHPQQSIEQPHQQTEQSPNTLQQGPSPETSNQEPGPAQDQSTFSFYDPEVGVGPKNDDQQTAPGPGPAVQSSSAVEAPEAPEPEAFADQSVDLPMPHSQQAAVEDSPQPHEVAKQLQREVEEEGAFVSSVDNSLPIDEAIATRAGMTQPPPSPPASSPSALSQTPASPPTISVDPPLAGSGSNLENKSFGRMDPPEDEPPSLSGSRTKANARRGDDFNDAPDDERARGEPPQMFPDSGSTVPSDVPSVHNITKLSAALAKSDIASPERSNNVQGDYKSTENAFSPRSQGGERSYFDGENPPSGSSPADQHDQSLSQKGSYSHEFDNEHKQSDEVGNSFDQSNDMGYAHDGHGRGMETDFDSPTRDEYQTGDGEYYSPDDRGHGGGDFYDEGRGDGYSPRQSDEYAPEHGDGYVAEQSGSFSPREGATVSTQGDGYSQRHDAYSRGHDDGFSRGHDDGFSRGHDDGFSQGHDDSYSQGHGDGYSQGDGHSRGHAEGYSRGQGDGYSQGQGDGYSPREGDGYSPGQGDGYSPREGDGYSPGQGDYPPDQGDGYSHGQGDSYSPRQGDSYSPRQGEVYSPQQSEGYLPEQEEGSYDDYGHSLDNVSPRGSYGTSSYSASPPNMRGPPRDGRASAPLHYSGEGGEQFVPIQMDKTSRPQRPKSAAPTLHNGDYPPHDQIHPQQDHPRQDHPRQTIPDRISPTDHSRQDHHRKDHHRKDHPRQDHPRQDHPRQDHPRQNQAKSQAGSGVSVSNSTHSDTTGSDYTPSSAMRGAQELLRKNRQKRLAMASRRNTAAKKLPPSSPEDEGNSSVGDRRNHDNNSSALGRRNQNGRSPTSDDGTWDTGTNATSVISGSSIVSGSSVWTENTNPADRSSRRALILQMAKARMKSNQNSGNSVSSRRSKPSQIAEEKSVNSGSAAKLKNRQRAKEEPEEPVNGDLDFSGDLD